MWRIRQAASSMNNKLWIERTYIFFVYSLCRIKLLCCRLYSIKFIIIYLIVLLASQVDVFYCDSMPALLLAAECGHQTVSDASWALYSLICHKFCVRLTPLLLDSVQGYRKLVQSLLPKHFYLYPHISKCQRNSVNIAIISLMICSLWIVEENDRFRAGGKIGQAGCF